MSSLSKVALVGIGLRGYQKKALHFVNPVNHRALMFSHLKLVLAGASGYRFPLVPRTTV